MSFLSPEADGYKTTPAARVRAGVATLAIAPTETVISSHRPRDTWKEQPRLKVGQAKGCWTATCTICLLSRESQGAMQGRQQTQVQTRCDWGSLHMNFEPDMGSATPEVNRSTLASRSLGRLAPHPSWVAELQVSNNNV